MNLFKNAMPIALILVTFFGSTAPIVADRQIKHNVARQFLLAMPGHEAFVTLEKHFPKDALKFVKTLARTKESTSPETLARRFHKLSLRIRQKNARYMWSAPAKYLVALSAFHRDALIYLRHDTDACNGFYLEGISALSPKANARFKKTKNGRNYMISLEALAAGRDTPVRRKKPRRSDYDAFIDAAIDAGMTEQDFLNIEESKRENPELCQSAIKFMKVVHDSNFEGINRLRAEIFYYSMTE